MRKSFLLVLCLCISSSIWLLHLSKPVENVPVQSDVTRPTLSSVETDCPVDISISVVTNSIKAPTIQIEPGFDVIVAVQPAVTNVSADVPNRTGSDEKSDLLRKLREWAASDAEGALSGVLKLPVCEERNEALAAVCYGMAQTDPAVAIETAKTLKLDQQPGGVMENLVQQWATTDFSSALDWVNNQPAGDQRNDLTRRIAFVLSETQPASAAILVIDQIPPGVAQNKAILTVLDLWANKDVDSAIAWASEFPEGPLRDEALGKLEHQRLVAQ
jgi:hypothetical protein